MNMDLIPSLLDRPWKLSEENIDLGDQYFSTNDSTKITDLSHVNLLCCFVLARFVSSFLQREINNSLLYLIDRILTIFGGEYGGTSLRIRRTIFNRSIRKRLKIIPI